MSQELAAMPTHKPSGLLEIVNHIRDIYDLGSMLVKSRMIPSSIATPEAAAAIIMKGHELGISPMQAFDSISVIQGKPTISPQLMVALIERSGLLEDKQVSEEPDSCTITGRRKGRSAQTVTFTRSDAVAMGLAGKDNWKKQFSVMMYWRCEAKFCRRVFPDVIAGCYTPDEMGAEVGEDGEIIDGEIIPQTQQELPPPVKTKGLHTGDHKARTAEFTAWLSTKVSKVNEKWAEAWEDALKSKQDEGFAVPEKMPEVVTGIQVKGHLLKWAKDAEWIDPAIVPEDVKAYNCEAYLATVFHEDGGKEAILAELGEYIAKQRKVKEAAFYRKHPDLAPEGFVEEQREAAEKAAESLAPPDRGDAYEEPAEEALAN